MQRHVERREDKVCSHLNAEGPTDDLAAAGIRDHGQVQKSFPGRHVRHISDPKLIDGLGDKHPFDQVGGGALAFIALGGRAPGAPAVHALDAHRPHEAGNAFAAGIDARIDQLGADPGHAVRFIAGAVGLADGLAQDHVVLPSLA